MSRITCLGAGVGGCLEGGPCMYCEIKVSVEVINATKEALLDGFL